MKDEQKNEDRMSYREFFAIVILLIIIVAIGLIVTKPIIMSDYQNILSGLGY